MHAQNAQAESLGLGRLRHKAMVGWALVLGLVSAWLMPLGAQANDNPVETHMAAVSASATHPDGNADEAEQAAPAVTAASEEAAAVPSNRRPTLRAGTLDGRVQLLAKELDLSPTQQGQVKKVLMAQRQQVAALWNDTSVPAALRVSRTQTIGDRTADQIRALLNEAQREKYIKPRARDTKVGSAGARVESWPAPAKAK